MEYMILCGKEKVFSIALPLVSNLNCCQTPTTIYVQLQSTTFVKMTPMC